MMIAASVGVDLPASVLVPALVSATVAVLALVAGARSRTKDRQRELFGLAFAAIMDYREFVYIVRRRTETTDRETVTDALSHVQASLNTYRARLRIESAHVGVAYDDLVLETRQVAGATIRAAWDLDVEIADVHAPDVDLSCLSDVDDRFVIACRQHLSSWPIAALERLARPTRSQ